MTQVTVKKPAEVPDVEMKDVEVKEPTQSEKDALTYEGKFSILKSFYNFINILKMLLKLY